MAPCGFFAAHGLTSAKLPLDYLSWPTIGNPVSNEELLKKSFYIRGNIKTGVFLPKNKEVFISIVIIA